LLLRAAKSCCISRVGGARLANCRVNSYIGMTRSLRCCS
jgi:hypothetical protein